MQARREVAEKRDKMAAVLQDAKVLLLTVDANMTLTFFDGSRSLKHPISSFESINDLTLPEAWPDSNLEAAVRKAMTHPTTIPGFTGEIVLDNGVHKVYRYHVNLHRITFVDRSDNGTGVFYCGLLQIPTNERECDDSGRHRERCYRSSTERNGS